MILERIRKNRTQIESDLRDSPSRKYFSASINSMYRVLVPRLRSRIHGKVLDVGAGTMPFKAYLDGSVDEYRALDVEERSTGIDFVCDVQDMAPVPSSAFDGLLCSQVLEHVSEPQRALCEMSRVLRPGGTLVLSVPFLSRLHEEPHDYFRFTEYGLRVLLEGSGFVVDEIVPAGSFFCFLGHQISTLFVCSVWHVPLLKRLVFWLNALLFTLPFAAVDRALRIERVMPLNYVVVASKRSDAGEVRPS